MAKQTNPDLYLSGRVFVPDEASGETHWVAYRPADYQPLPGERILPDTGMCDGSRLVMIPHMAGDIQLYLKADMYGRYARQGNHTNFGYSGYFKASIFDGKKWRSLALWSLLDQKEYHYQGGGDARAALDELKEKLEILQGARVSYELPEGRKRRTYMLASARSKS